MNIQCNVEELKNAISLVERMSGKNLTLPILHSVLISTNKNTLVLRATNLAVGIEVEIPATVTAEGVIAIKGDILINVCNNINQTQDIKIKTDNENIIIEGLKTKTTIKCLSSDEFPQLPVVEGETFQIKNNLLQEGIRSVYFAASVNDIKPEIASIYIYSEDETIYFVATDSFRLAERKIKIKGFPDISKILLPYKNINDILRTLDYIGENIDVSYTRNQISLSCNGVYFTSRLIDGGFPMYQTIIPKEESTKIVVIKQDLINTLRLSTVFADKFFQVILTINPQEKQVTISSKNSDVGSSINMIDSVISGESIEVVFNLKYFLDVFQALPGDSVSISFTKPNKPILVRSVNDKNFLYLLMPTNR